MITDELLRIEDLRLTFRTMYGIVSALNDVNLQINKNEIVGIVGESGSGKTVLGLSIMRLVPIPPGRIEAGRIFLRGQDLVTLSDEQMDKLRGTSIAMIFQEPMTALNPVFTVGEQIAESVKVRIKRDRETVRSENPPHAEISPRTERPIKEQVTEALKLVRIPDYESVVRRYPHELSGGMRQRIMIAMALAAKPSLIIADEPTTALDVTTQAQILMLMRRLMEEVSCSIAFISHDLGVIAQIADRVAVMYAGSIVEEAPVNVLFERPVHPYTQDLLKSLPSIGVRKLGLETIKGEVPSLLALPSGCPFHPRCRYAIEECREKIPTLIEVESNHKVACPVKCKG
jgi:oligopeptide/dipeptide ABC transporter ATP-binding protein